MAIGNWAHMAQWHLYSLSRLFSAVRYSSITVLFPHLSCLLSLVLHPTPPACQLLFCPHTIEDATKSSEDSTDEKKRMKKKKRRECSLLAVTQCTGKVLNTDIILRHSMQRKFLRIRGRLLLPVFQLCILYYTYESTNIIPQWHFL